MLPISQYNKLLSAFKITGRLVLFFSMMIFSHSVLPGCKNSEPVQIAFNESVNGQTVKVEPNQEFSIKLSSNPSTGFKWEWRPNETEIIKFISSKYKPASEEKNIVGGGGIETFIFKTSRIGIDEIELVYRRAWEKDVPPAKIVRFVVDAH
jgi:inhibitor of cysteine peptidase